LEFVKILIFITVDIFKHTAKKIKQAVQILPEVYGTTLTGWQQKPSLVPLHCMLEGGESYFIFNNNCII
jgi:hypothetical protein